MKIHRLISAVAIATILVCGLLSVAEKSGVAEQLSPKGNALPKPDPAFKGKIGETYKDSTPSYPQPLTAPKGSPNVLLILLDDVGFGVEMKIYVRQNANLRPTD